MCRSFLGKWKNEKGEEEYLGRANLGVVSINLPLLALESDNESTFYQKIEEYMNLSYRAHIERVNKLKTIKAKENPILYTEGVIARLDPEDTLEKILYDGRFSISIGYIGLAECSTILKGKLDKDFCKSILSYMKFKCEQFKKDSSLSFSLYGTPKP